MSIVTHIAGERQFILSFRLLVYKITEVRDRMFELNETINWKPNRQEKVVLEIGLKPMIGIYPVLGFGNPLPIWRTEDKQEEV
jgi:isoleucyl-tRNA synthetase